MVKLRGCDTIEMVDNAPSGRSLTPCRGQIEDPKRVLDPAVLRALIRFAVRKPGVAVICALGMALYGCLLFSRAGLDVFPEFAPRSVVIQTEAPGLAAEEVETRVTQILERQLAGLPNLLRVKSESIQGLSVVTAVFSDTTDIVRDRQLVGERLLGLKDKLPEGIAAPMPLPLSSSSATILTIGLTSERSDGMTLRTLADWTVVPRLLGVPGVADVNVFGGEVRQLQIQVEPENLVRHGLEVRDVTAAVRELVQLRGAGFVENDNQRFLVRMSGREAVEQLGDAVLVRRGGANIKVRDVATVAFGPEPPTSAAQIKGQSGVVMMVIGQYGANTLTVSRAVEAALQEMQTTLQAQGVSLHPRLFRPADYIEKSVHNMVGHLAIGVVFVLLVLLVFLQRLTPAVISALAIPLSLIMAVVVLLQLGMSLNVMVLGGLGIALGEVVDDAIIDVENIFRRVAANRHRSEPIALEEVIINASTEVRGSVVYASFIVAVVFLPLLALDGVAGRLFAPLGSAYILAVLASLVVALTVTPALCQWALRAHGSGHRRQWLVECLQPHYAALLACICRNPRPALAIALVCLAVAMIPAAQFGGRFLPALREGHYIAHTLTLPGTALNESIRVGSLITQTLLQIPGIKSVSQWAGRAERGADTYGSHYSEFEIALQPASGRQQQKILEQVRRAFATVPGLSFEINTFLIERVDETISGSTAPVVINVFGTDFDALDREAQRIVEVVRGIPGAVDVQTRSSPMTPVVDVHLRPEMLAAWGLQAGTVLAALENAYAGSVVGRGYAENQPYDIAILLPQSLRRDPQQLALLPIRTPDNTVVRMAQLANISQQTGRYNVLRQNAQRLQVVTCGFDGGDLTGFVRELRLRLQESVKTAPGTYFEIAGAALERDDAQTRLLVHAVLAGIAVLVLAYLALDRFRHVLILVLNLPIALVGGVVSTALTGGSLSVGSLVGFVTLFGITVRNSIMMISHYGHLVATEGCDWGLATVIRGAQERLPSVLMTALVTGLAMLPIAIDSDNAGREIMGPMAAIIVGGLCTSTILNLLLLPPVMLRYGRFGISAQRDDHH